MTLRTQIHHALDSVSPPAPALERRVKTFVLSDRETRKQLRVRPRSPWNTRFRGTVALVAAALVVVLIGGLILGGRFWRNENLPPQTIGQNELKSLESRPLQFPIVAPGAPCPASPEKVTPGLGMAFGDGPVYVVSGGFTEPTDWGYWVSPLFAYNDTKPGLVLIRARDLKSDATVAFAQYPLTPTAVLPVGSVLGISDVASHRLQLRSEAVFPDKWHAKPFDKQGDLPPLIGLVGLQKGSSGCIGFQIDGPGFTENLVLPVSS